MPEQEYDTTLPVDDAAAAAETVTPEVTAPPAEAEAEATPEVGTPQPTFTVTVDGEQFEVSAEEAIRGYQRQADYTRKTQGVAAEAQALASEREQLSQAERLWNAIEKNPQATLAVLASEYGLTLTPAQQQAAAEAAEADPFADLLQESQPAVPAADPRWEAVEQFMRSQTEREQNAAVEAELAAVHAKYGTTIPATTLIEYALDNDIGSLDAAYRALSFEAAQQAAVRARKAGRKQELPPVNGGHPVQGGILVPGAGSALPSFEEAFAAAQAELDG